MKKKILILVGVIIVILGIGGKIYMDKKHVEDLQELHEVQKDLANHLYTNYRLYTRDQTKVDKIYEEFDYGNGSLTEDDYFEKLDKLREYEEIEKIEFTGYSVSPMKILHIHFVINDVYKADAGVATIDVETDQIGYQIDPDNDNGNYYTEYKGGTSEEKEFPDDKIIYL